MKCRLFDAEWPVMEAAWSFQGDTTSLLLHFAKEAKLGPAKLANAVPVVGLLLALVLIFGPSIPFDPRWFNVTME